MKRLVDGRQAMPKDKRYGTKRILEAESRIVLSSPYGVCVVWCVEDLPLPRPHSREVVSAMLTPSHREVRERRTDQILY